MRADSRPDLGNRAFRLHRESGLQLCDQGRGTLGGAEVMHREVERGGSRRLHREIDQACPGAAGGADLLQRHNSSRVDMQERPAGR